MPDEICGYATMKYCSNGTIPIPGVDRIHPKLSQEYGIGLTWSFVYPGRSGPSTNPGVKFRTDGTCAPARDWLAWCEGFSSDVDPSRRQGFFIVSRFVFCQQILSADFPRQQMCLLSADSVSRFRPQITLVQEYRNISLGV